MFEIYIANREEGITSIIIMPDMEKEKMIRALGKINNLFNALSNTRIEDAEVTQPEDKKNLLHLIKDDIGYDDEFNITVNVSIRDWISKTLLSIVEDDGTNLCEQII